MVPGLVVLGVLSGKNLGVSFVLDVFWVALYLLGFLARAFCCNVVFGDVCLVASGHQQDL